MTTRIALFSDVHANLPALEAVLADIRRRHAEDPFSSVYCLGDIGGYAAEPNETQDLLQQSGYATLAGNYDENVGLDRDDCGCQYVSAFDIKMSDISFTWTRDHTTRVHKQRLRALPHEFRFKVEGHRVLLCHGSPHSIVEYLFENRSDGYLRQFAHGGRYNAHADVICFGHTHAPYHRVVGGVHFINTGSVGRPKDGDWRAGYCILFIDGSDVISEQVRVDYDIDATCQRLIAAGLPEYFADYLRTGGNVPVPVG
jgi:putative phosphoesterase